MGLENEPSLYTAIGGVAAMNVNLLGALGITVTADITGDTADLDSGAGSDPHEVFAVGLPGSGGHVVGGTATNPFRTDPTGVTTQPVSFSGAVDTELPAAAALTDNFANPTAPGVGAFGMLWDGATWDRAPGTSVDGQLVNLGANNDVIIDGVTPKGTNFAKAEDAASADADVGVGAMAIRKATPANISGTDGDYEFLQMSAGRLWASVLIDTAIPAGNNNIGDVDVVSIVPGTGATNLGKAEDAIHATGDVGMFMLGVRNDTYSGSTSLTNADGDYAALQIDSKGLLKVSNQAYGTLGRPNYYIDVASAGLFEVPTTCLVDPTTGSLAAITSGALNVVNSSSASNTLFDTKASVAGTALTGSYQTLKVVAGSSVTDIFLLNSCNQTIVVSMDGGTNDTYQLDPYESITMSVAQFHNHYYAGTISVKHNGVVPTAGTIRYAGMKA